MIVEVDVLRDLAQKLDEIKKIFDEHDIWCELEEFNLESHFSTVNGLIWKELKKAEKEIKHDLL